MGQGAQPWEPDPHSPHHREEDGPAAQQVHQEERVFPQAIVSRALLRGLDDNVGHVGQYLDTGREARSQREA